MFVCDVQIQPDMIHLMLTSCVQKHQITAEVCDNDANTSIVKVALTAANIIGSVEVSCSYSIPKRHSVIILSLFLGKGRRY